MSNKQASTNGTAQAPQVKFPDLPQGVYTGSLDVDNNGELTFQAHTQQQPDSIVGTLSVGDIGLVNMDKGATSGMTRVASHHTAAQAAVKPQAHISLFENDFLEALDKLRLCFAVLELTRTERTLISEADALAAYIESENLQPKLNYPQAARSPAKDKAEDQYRSVLIHYQTAISNAMSAIAHMFDDGYRLRQPYYSDAIMNGMRVRLLDRCSVATDAYLYVTNLRGNAHDPLTYSPASNKATSK